MTSRPLILCCFTTLSAALFASCDSSPSTPPRPGNTSIQFTAATTTPGSNTLTLKLRSATSSTLTLDVVGTSLTNVASCAFDVVFNASVIGFSSATAGSLITGGTGTLQFLAQPDTTGTAGGRIVVGIAFVPDTVGVSGTGPIASIVFNRVATGSTAISFEATGVFRPGHTLAGTTFAGGSVRVP